MSLLHQRQQQQEKPLVDSSSIAAGPPPPRTAATIYSSLLGRSGLLAIVFLLLLLGLLLPWSSSPLFSPSAADTARSLSSRWKDYSLAQATAFVARDGTLIVCAVSQPYLPFLNNWLISIARQGHHQQVLVVAEDYATLFEVNRRWPGHAVLVPPAPDSQTAHKFGSQGFFNFTSRRPRHLLQILDLGYNVMYNDVDMVWLADPFPYLVENHDVYFTDDMAAVKPLDHPHSLPPPGKKGRTYICSCMIYLRPTEGAKRVLQMWIEELKVQPWSKKTKSNDQPAFNWALNKTAGQVDLYLLSQAAFPSGGLYFKNATWVKETKGMHVIIHNNYITGFDKKIKRFRDYGLWLADEHSNESPLDGSTCICSCFIFLCPKEGGKQVVRIWIEEVRNLQWSEEEAMLISNDQPPSFNWALNKTAGDQVDQYLLSQVAFPSGAVYFWNPNWVEETKGMQVVVHNNYIIGYDTKLQR